MWRDTTSFDPQRFSAQLNSTEPNHEIKQGAVQIHRARSFYGSRSMKPPLFINGTIEANHGPKTLLVIRIYSIISHKKPWVIIRAQGTKTSYGRKDTKLSHAPNKQKQPIAERKPGYHTRLMSKNKLLILRKGYQAPGIYYALLL